MTTGGTPLVYRHLGGHGIRRDDGLDHLLEERLDPSQVVASSIRACRRLAGRRDDVGGAARVDGAPDERRRGARVEPAWRARRAPR